MCWRRLKAQGFSIVCYFGNESVLLIFGTVINLPFFKDDELNQERCLLSWTVMINACILVHCRILFHSTIHTTNKNAKSERGQLVATMNMKIVLIPIFELI